MKRLLLFSAFLAASFFARSQSCYEIVLSFYNGDSNVVDMIDSQKFDFRCRYARNAFYRSEVVPVGAEVRSLTEVINRSTGEPISGQDFFEGVPIYYSFNFHQMQLSYPSPDAVICFPLNDGSGQYLVLRSLNDTYFRTEYPEQYE